MEDRHGTDRPFLNKSTLIVDFEQEDSVGYYLKGEVDKLSQAKESHNVPAVS